jgi:hypothetical protein
MLSELNYTQRFEMVFTVSYLCEQRFSWDYTLTNRFKSRDLSSLDGGWDLRDHFKICTLRKGGGGVCFSEFSTFESSI